MKNQNALAIIILNWNGISDTLDCISSVKKNSFKDFQIIVADNGSADNSIDIIKTEYPEVTIIDNKKNLGFAEGNNRAIDYAINNSFKFIFLLNNDTTIDQHCLRSLMLSYASLPTDSILGCKICYSTDKEKIWHFGSKWNKKKLKLEKLATNEPANDHMKIQEVDQIVGCAMWISVNTVKTVGLLEKRYFLNYEETDWCFRAKRAGHNIYSIPNAIVYHKISASFKGSAHSNYFLSRNRLLWIQRNFPTHTRIRFYLTQDIPAFMKMTIKLPLRIIFLPPLYIFDQQSYNHNIDKILSCISSYVGIAHYHLKKFGNCPNYIIKLSLLRKKNR